MKKSKQVQKPRIIFKAKCMPDSNPAFISIFSGHGFEFTVFHTTLFCVGERQLQERLGDAFFSIFTYFQLEDIENWIVLERDVTGKVTQVNNKIINKLIKDVGGDEKYKKQITEKKFKSKKIQELIQKLING